MKKYRWGIIGPGNIANNFMKAAAVVDRAKVIAVGGRNPEKTRTFAEKYGIPKACGTEEIALDPEIDAVYIAVVNSAHKEHILRCLQHGKAVLCEKPMVMNTHDAEEVMACANRSRAFLMEAMWTRFLPTIHKAVQLLEEGIIGEQRNFRSEFCFSSDWPDDCRLMSPELGGGALADVGVYSISLANLFLKGLPAELQSEALIGRTGVDLQCEAIMRYSNGETACFRSAVNSWAPGEAVISGTKGFIRIPHFWSADELTVTCGAFDGGKAFHFPINGSGFEYEINEVHECLDKGQLQSGVNSLQDTYAVIKIMEQLRECWNRGRKGN